MAEKLDSLREAAIAETGRLMQDEERCDSIPFYNPKVGFLLEEFPRRFGHIKPLMKAYKRILKALKIEPHKLDDYQKRQRNDTLSYKLTDLIRNYFRPELERRAVDVASLLTTDDDMLDLQKMGAGFLEREDLSYPPGDYKFNAWREFQITINDRTYTCTLVVSPDGDRKVSFILDTDGIKRFSPVISLNPHDSHSKLSQRELMMLNIYEAAKGCVNEFFRMQETQKTVAGIVNKYDAINLFGVLYKLANRDVREKLTKQDLGGVSGVDIAALETFTFYLNFAQDNLNAAELSAMSVGSIEELEEVMKDRPTFVVHVMQGLLRLFKHVMTEGSGGATDIFAGLDERQKLLMRLNGSGKKGPAAQGSTDIANLGGVVTTEVQSALGESMSA